MKAFRDDAPIYLQLREQIEELILEQRLNVEDAVPSFRSLAKDYGINPLTVSNAINSLVEEGVLYRKRGIGIFVSPKAREHIINTRSKKFIHDTIIPSIQRALKLEIPKSALTQILNTIYGEKS